MWIIWVVLIIGNLALFSGSFEDLPLLSILAIIGDLYFIYTIIKGIADSPSKNPPTQVSSSQPTPQQVGTRSTPPSTQRTPPVIEDNNKLNQLKSKYRVPNVTSVATAVDPLQKEMESYQCIEVLQNVNKAISRRRNCAKKMKSIKEEIDGSSVYKVGIVSKGDVKHGFIPSIQFAFSKMGSLFRQMIITFKGLFTGGLSVNQLSGPVGIYNIVGEQASLGFENMLYLIALLSVNVGFINLIPLPAFDGGRILFLIIEKIKGSPVKAETENKIHTIGFILLLALMLYITFNDILKLF